MSDELIRADLDKQPGDVRRMFDGVAKRYDLTNTVMTGGLDRLWRQATRKALDLRRGQRVLDLACGTGVSTVELAKSGAYAVGADFSTGMLERGMQTEAVRDSGVPLVAGDAMQLPFADAVFDAAVISFGIRNIPDVDGALREMARVVRPGGRLAICEFSTPTNKAFRTVYMEYLMRAFPKITRPISSNPEAYSYLAESIRAWPDQESFAHQIQRGGWDNVQWRNLSGGLVALHRATRGRAA